MTSTPKSGKYVHESESTSSSPLAGSGPGGHKASFKSTKLAKRARSFKDDFLEKLSQMRSPTNQGVRSQSPKGRPVKNYIIQEDMAFNNKGPIQELHHQQKQISIALKHFRDVVLKKKLEMLPGNGTIVLDTIWAINLTVQRSTVSPECGEMIKRATDYMYASVAKLIKLCDDALIDEQSSALDEPNVVEVVKHVEKSVESLIKLVQQKITQPNVMYMTTPRASYSASNLDMPAQRNSLPDIPLTDREREILEKNSSTPRMVRSSHSTESILRDSSPPPKPPLPHNMYRKDTDTYITPPPLPPKKRNMDNYVVCYNSDNSIFQSSLERMSLRSRSPEDSSSLLSASAGSLDSVLNHSREEEEITALMDHNTDNDTVMENDLSEITGNGFANYLWQDQDSFLNTTHPSLLNHSGDLHVNNSEYNRLSNTDSGFMSVQSHRSSSYSKRSSQQSSSSSQWNAQQFSAKQSSSSVSEMIKSESISQNLRSCSENHTFLNMQSLSQKSSAYVSNFSTNQKSIVIGDETDSSLIGDCVPPAIPQKTRRKPERQPSPYDNVPDTNLGGELLVTCQMHQSHQSLSSNTSITNVHQDGNCPPPLPPKKKHIMAYMEMFGNCSHSSDQEFMRHSVHIQGHWAQSPKPGLPTTQSCSFSHTSSHSSSRSSHTQVQTLTLPHSSGDNSPIPSPMRSPNLALTPINSTPPALPPKRSRSSSSRSSPPATPRSTSIMEMKSPIKSLPDLLEHTTLPKSNEEVPESLDPTNLCDIDLMEETDVIKYLIFKTTDEDGPDIRGGCIDALIIQATKATKNGVFAYQEAFLTTYRTFITPFDLISKLIRRYKHFKRQPDKKPKEAFALVIRVVNDLTPGDLDRDMQQTLMDFVQELICSGDITLAKALRVKHLERHDAKQLSIKLFSNPNQDVAIQPFKQTMMTLVDFKSEQIAEQMTYLDAELFMKIEIPEVLIWAQEQNEERSPNLTKFTEHFNKMSYWARAKILKADDAKDREKYFMKFIKIMKHLRKINNFNSYLALLSALDSAPIRRLEWQKHVQDGLKEYCALIDSSSSFRAYRQALAETQPPCIPYIGLVLQDLTFVHIGNSNVVTNNGVSYINFSKRWQQYNIVENMKKFKKCAYAFKRNDKIIDFFNNFKCDIDEDEMWNISESIKPRGSKKPAQ